MFTESVYQGKDSVGNHLYAPKWITSIFADKSIYQTDFDMSSPSDKALALRVVQPFAMVADRIGSMMRNGKYYVVDKNDNERPRYSEVLDLLDKPNLMQDGKSFLKQIEIYLRVFGYCPIFCLRATKSDLPKAMVVIPPEMFHVQGKGGLFNARKRKIS